MASAAMWRCLCPARLRGHEIKAVRKIMGLTLSELAKKLGEKTAVETISRWESEVQPVGGYAEKLVRLLVCETLKDKAPGIDYDGSLIANLPVIDPWMADPDFELPPMEFGMVRVRERGSLIDAWEGTKCAA
jgi:transcriptional regulator with XRE-family HTH domain